MFYDLLCYIVSFFLALEIFNYKQLRNDFRFKVKSEINKGSGPGHEMLPNKGWFVG